MVSKGLSAYLLRPPDPKTLGMSAVVVCILEVRSGQLSGKVGAFLNPEA